ncbi:MAG: GerMN domain-containing protein [Spirochaetota bacterium]|nr:GerMN domain-containing protein [Spirochaetota bacterium]
MINNEYIKAYINKYQKILLDFIKQYIKIILICCFVFLFITIFSLVKYFSGIANVYYIEKDKGIVFSEKIFVYTIGLESDIQSFLRAYLTGSQNYKAKIPFTYETRLISVSHDKNKKILILNWNSYFYRALEQKDSDREIKILLKSLKHNFSIDKVYFLVEGSKLAIELQDNILGDGIELNQIN